MAHTDLSRLDASELTNPRRVAVLAVHTSPLAQPGVGDAGGMNVYVLQSALHLARRGVEVELFVGGIGDQFFVFHAQHSYYEELLEAGVRIYEYSPPTILHAKHMSIDDLVSVVGSSNMDIRSFNLDFEVSMMCSGPGFVRQMREVEDEYRTVSRELTLEEWKRRPLTKRWLDNVMRLTSAVQ